MAEGLGFAAAYVAAGFAVLALGFWILDLLTPGRLADHIWRERSTNAAVVLASGFLALGGIVATSIWVHADAGFGEAFAWTVAFGVLGAVLQAVALVLLDLVTPGRLGDLVHEPTFHPASLVTAASQIAIAAIVIASIA